MTLPAFPVDDTTLDMLMAAIDPWGNGDPDAEHSSVVAFLEFMSNLGGSETTAGEEIAPSVVRLTHPQYSSHDVLTALVEEIRRLRAA